VKVELKAVGRNAREAWRHALAVDCDALVSQTPAWMDCVCASGRYEDVTRAYETEDGYQLILPLAQRRLPNPVTAVSSMPFGWGTGGLISSLGRASTDDVASVLADLKQQRTTVVALRPSPLTHDVWAPVVPNEAVRIAYMSQTVDLVGGFDRAWHGFSSAARRQCRKAVRLGVTAERDDTGRLIPVFDALYRKSVDRWARQQHEPRWLAHWRARQRDPREKFQTVAERLGRACHVWVAWHAGEPVAGVVVLTHGHHTTYWRGAMDKDAARGTGANELLHQHVIEEACDAGHLFYHLGDSTPSSGLARYKSRYGANEALYSAYRFERLPVTTLERFVRREAKRAIGFRD
jgi:hypothetical protein